MLYGVWVFLQCIVLHVVFLMLWFVTWCAIVFDQGFVWSIMGSWGSLSVARRMNHRDCPDVLLATRYSTIHRMKISRSLYVISLFISFPTCMHKVQWRHASKIHVVCTSWNWCRRRQYSNRIDGIYILNTRSNSSFMCICIYTCAYVCMHVQSHTFWYIVGLRFWTYLLFEYNLNFWTCFSTEQSLSDKLQNTYILNTKYAYMNAR